MLCPLRRDARHVIGAICLSHATVRLSPAGFASSTRPAKPGAESRAAAAEAMPTSFEMCPQADILNFAAAGTKVGLSLWFPGERL